MTLARPGVSPRTVTRRSTTRLTRYLRRLGLVSRTVLAVRMTGLSLVGVGLVLLTLWRPNDVSWGLYCPLVVLAGIFLPPRPFLAVCGVYAACLAFSGFAVRGWSAVQIVTVAAVVLTMLLMYERSRSRERLGVQGSDGDDMLVNLRDQLTSLADVEGLPQGWHTEHWIQSAYGDKFSGDFAVASTSPDREWLEIALVDLSGKGAGVGTIGLLFSGALGGLLGQVEPNRLLCAANSYLLRQGWAEGFATAVHVSVHLPSGRFTVGTAGHPGPVHFVAGSGRWKALEPTGGPALGVIPGADYPRAAGVLARGDALVMYTDGVIESPGHDLELGVDRMVGAAEAMLQRGLQGGAKRLCAGAKAGDTDDRAVVLLWRD
ncbi:MAG: PP2C family protein-serine/threonine phosphatase [Dermatophilaceae bacterium]